MKSFINEVTERPLRVGGPSFRPTPDGWRERPEGPREGAGPCNRGAGVRGWMARA